MDATNIEMYPKVKSSKLTTSRKMGRMLSDPLLALRMFGIQENIPGRPGTRAREAGILRPTLRRVTCIKRRYIYEITAAQCAIVELICFAGIFTCCN